MESVTILQALVSAQAGYLIAVWTVIFLFLLLVAVAIEIICVLKYRESAWTPREWFGGILGSALVSAFLTYALSSLF
jgi:heme/copper-type cytochrome/quinol oxidase subunit 2